MNSFLRFSLLLLSCCGLFFVACETPKNGQELENPVYFQSQNELETATTTTLTNRVDAITADPTLGQVIKGLVKYNIKVSKILYKTTNAKGASVVASGLLMVPQNITTIKGLPVVTVLHGSLPNKEDAPTKALDNLVVVGAKLLASMGGMVVMPDYVGYGNTENEEHPYEHNALAKISADMILAAKEYCKQANIALYSKVMLTGYSQGATVCVATHKHIEENLSNKISLFTSVAGSGAYDKINFTKAVLQEKKKIFFLPFYLWVLHAYQNAYNLNLPYDSIFNEPYLSYFSKINFNFRYAMFNYVEVRAPGATSDTLAIYGKLAGIPSDFIIPSKLFKASFIQKVLTEDVSISPFIQSLKENTIINWAPKTKLVLCHGDVDDFSYTINSTNAYTAMRKLSGNVELQLFSKKDHFTGYGDYIFRVLTEYSSFLQESK